MGIQAIDIIQKGDWLVCEAGPKIMIRSPFSEELIERRDKEMEGILARVMAVNPPILLLEIYTLSQKKFPVSINFYDAVWSKANEGYKTQYLKLRGPKSKLGAEQNE